MSSAAPFLDNIQEDDWLAGVFYFCNTSELPMSVESTPCMPIDDLDKDRFRPAAHHPLVPDEGREATVYTIHSLGAELQRLREATGLTQAEVAEDRSWSESKVTRFESGDIKVTPSDLEGLLRLYGVTDEQGAKLLNASLAAKAKRVTVYNSILAPRYRQYMEYEAGAERIAVYSSTLLLPEFLRPERNARTVERLLATYALSPHGRRVKNNPELQAQLRRSRAAYLLGRSGPGIHCIIDEAVFGRLGGEDQKTKGSASELAVVVRGLQRLITIGERESPDDAHLNPGITIQIAPFAVMPPSEEGYPFSLMRAHQSPTAAHISWTEDQGFYFGQSDIRQEYLAKFVKLSQAIPKPDETHDRLESILHTYGGTAPQPQRPMK